jgi:hypothetical protein
MAAQVYRIIHKKRRWFPEMLASLGDFKLQKYSPVDAGHLLGNPQVSLYAIDIKNNNIVFVETPPHLDLISFPFYFLAQYEHATKVITLSFDEFTRVTEALPYPDKNFIFLYSVGRAGSTLMTNIFAGDQDTVSLSEPDILSYFIPLSKNAPQEADCNKLLLSCLKLFSSAIAIKGKQRIVIKPRGFCIEIGAMLHKVLPDAKGIFLYRDAKPVIESFIRAFSFGAITNLLRDTAASRFLLTFFIKKYGEMLTNYFPCLNEYEDGSIYKTGWPGFLCIAWISIMKTYCLLYRQGIALKAVLYEDLINHPQDIISQLFDYCGISATSINLALKALERDSQEGTRLARSVAYKKQKYIKKINTEHLQLILKSQAEITATDFIVPGTINRIVA